jgi:hypothetical protein
MMQRDKLTLSKEPFPTLILLSLHRYTLNHPILDLPIPTAPTLYQLPKSSFRMNTMFLWTDTVFLEKRREMGFVDLGQGLKRVGRVE